MRVHSPRSLSRVLELRACAKGLRRAPTASEQLLWSRLRCRQLGVAFRRQVVLGQVIVDFYASSARLVVEVDGEYHARRDRQDARRDAALRRAGYRVLRIPAEVVTGRIDEAVVWVREALRF